MRKNVVIDQRKLDVVRKTLGVATDKEAIDQALDRVVFVREVTDGLRSMRLAGGIDDVFKGR